MDPWTPIGLMDPWTLCLPHPERVGDSVRVAEPAGDDAKLEDRLVVEALGAELVEVLRAEPGGVARELLDELEHHVVRPRDVGRAVVVSQRLHEVGIERDATQKLCVGLQSIEAAVHRRDDRGDHFVLAPLERKVG